MKTLPYDKARCSGAYQISSLPRHQCPQRDTCQRYQALIHTDKASGIENYRYISVVMAVESCRDKIETVAHHTV